jgi:hypothetical protein
MKGSQITDIKRVIELARDKKCVIYRNMRTPASFVINFQARLLYNEIQGGHLFEYIKNT